MIAFYIGFLLLVFALLALDLGVLNRKEHEIGAKEALRWTAFWVSCALLFGVFVFFAYENHWLGIGLGNWKQSGSEAAINYLTGYLIEESLSLDNIFVIALIINSFAVPKKMQHRVLFWGILGALIMRGAMIGIGSALVLKFHWILYLFGAFLIFTALKMAYSVISKKHDEEFDADKSTIVRLLRKFFPVSSNLDGHNFFTRENGVLAATPLFAALVVIEFSDVIFAVDSIPAIFAITTDPFIVFTSNIFAILGLRSLYFALAALMDKFAYLKFSLIFILGFVGTKMLLPLFGVHLFEELPVYFNLIVIFFFLFAGVVASTLKKKNIAN